MIWYHYHTFLLPRGDIDNFLLFPKEEIIRKDPYYENSAHLFRDINIENERNMLKNDKKVHKKMGRGIPKLNINLYYPSLPPGKIINYEYIPLSVKKEKLPKIINLKGLRVPINLLINNSFFIEIINESKIERKWMYMYKEFGEKIEFRPEEEINNLEVEKVKIKFEINIPNGEKEGYGIKWNKYNYEEIELKKSEKIKREEERIVEYKDLIEFIWEV